MARPKLHNGPRGEIGYTIPANRNGSSARFRWANRRGSPSTSAAITSYMRRRPRSVLYAQAGHSNTKHLASHRPCRRR